MRPRHRELTGLALCSGLVFVLYWPFVSGRGAFFQRDVFLYWIPHIEWAARVLAGGALPQWNPFKGFGAPFLADPNFQFFYPPSLLNWILDSSRAYAALVVGHTLLGSIGVYRLLQPRLRSAPAGLIGSAVFACCGPIASSANLWHHFSSVMYLPWIVDAFLRLRSGRGSVKRLAFWSALAALAGSADACMMAGFTLVALLPFRAARLLKLAPRLAAAGLLCVSLVAIQWLPTALLSRSSSRAALDASARLHWSISPPSLISFVLPVNSRVFSSPDESFPLITWMYLGGSTLPLLLLGIRRAPRLGLLLLATLLLGLGQHTPLGAWSGSIPVVSMFRFPSKLLWLAAFCWAALAAVGYKALTGRPDRWSLTGAGVGASGVALSALLVLAMPYSEADHRDWAEAVRLLPWGPLALSASLLAAALGKRGRSLLPLIVVVDLVGMGQAYNAYSSSELLRMRPTIVDELRRLNAQRLFVFQKSRLESRSWRVPPSWTEEEAYYFGQAQFLSPPQAMRWSLRGSFDGDFTGLARPDYAALSGLASEGETIDPRWLRLGGVTHAVRFLGKGPPELRVAAEVRTFHDSKAVIMDVPNPLPFAYVVHSTRHEPSSEAALRLLAHDNFDPSREIVRVSPQLAPGNDHARGAPASEARLEYATETRAVIHARLETPGTLVVLNAFAEGWTARVDGSASVVLPANLVFQSVDLPAGSHRVELEYHTPGLAAGFGVSLLAWAWLTLQLTGTRDPRKA
jgi:Bacterial membrane protein YfhO